MNGDREMGRDRASEGKGMKERENSQQGAERQRGVGGLGAPGQPTYHPPCPPSRYWVRLGEHSLSKLDWTEQIRRSGLSVTHPSYRGNLGNHDNDLRLLRLGTPVRLTTSVQPLPLPTTCATAGTECHISGWGTTNPPWSKEVLGSGGTELGV